MFLLFHLAVPPHPSYDHTHQDEEQDGRCSPKTRNYALLSCSSSCAAVASRGRGYVSNGKAGSNVAAFFFSAISLSCGSSSVAVAGSGCGHVWNRGDSRAGGSSAWSGSCEVVSISCTNGTVQQVNFQKICSLQMTPALIGDRCPSKSSF